MWSQGLRSKRSNKVVPDHMASYLIRVETGSQSGAGTDATISISITGRLTVWILLSPREILQCVQRVSMHVSIAL